MTTPSTEAFQAPQASWPHPQGAAALPPDWLAAVAHDSLQNLPPLRSSVASGQVQLLCEHSIIRSPRAPAFAARTPEWMLSGTGRRTPQRGGIETIDCITRPT
jgi:hypothetical protein